MFKITYLNKVALKMNRFYWPKEEKSNQYLIVRNSNLILWMKDKLIEIGQLLLFKDRDWAIIN